MKILLIGGQSIPGIGGVESYMLNIAKSLREQDNEVTLLCSDREAFTQEIEGIRVIHKRCPKSNIIAIPLLFMKSIGYIAKHHKDIDVVNFQSILFAFVAGWFARLCRCKVCYTIHSLAEDSPKYGRMLKCLIKIITFISIYLCGKRIITISRSKAEEIKCRYGKRCFVIPCGVNMPTSCGISDILTRHGIVAGHYYLSIGRIDPIKNLDTLIEAFMRHNDSDYQLVIAGNYDNSYGADLRAMAKPNDRIIFTGSVMGDDKEQLLTNSFANCLISSSEGMPLALLEAMAHGKPSIVTDISAIREVMRPEWGLWCRVRDVESVIEQMARVEAEPDKIYADAALMADHVAKYHTWESIASQYVDYLHKI